MSKNTLLLLVTLLTVMTIASILPARSHPSRPSYDDYIATIKIREVASNELYLEVLEIKNKFRRVHLDERFGTMPADPTTMPTKIEIRSLDDLLALQVQVYLRTIGEAGPKVKIEYESTLQRRMGSDWFTRQLAGKSQISLSQLIKEGQFPTVLSAHIPQYCGACWHLEVLQALRLSTVFQIQRLASQDYSIPHPYSILFCRVQDPGVQDGLSLCAYQTMKQLREENEKQQQEKQKKEKQKKEKESSR